MSDVNRQWQVAHTLQSEGMCQERSCFGYAEAQIPTPGEGEILTRNTHFACEPLVHAMVRGVPGRIDPLPAGTVLQGHAGGQVIASNNPSYAVGDCVHGNIDWADYALSTGEGLTHAPDGFDLPTGMITLGMTGLCAYIGMFGICKPAPGDVVVVSAAAGGIGVIAGQIAKLAGAYTIGIAGGAEKCGRLTAEVGYDAAIDYKNDDVAARLAELAPGGVNVFFDNVGGPVLDAVLLNIANRGRVAICGGISGYDNPGTGLENLITMAQRNVMMQGFWYSEHSYLFEEGISCLGSWLRSGQLKEVFDMAEGFDAVPDAARGIFSGANMGKQLVHIADA